MFRFPPPFTLPSLLLGGERVKGVARNGCLLRPSGSDLPTTPMRL